MNNLRGVDDPTLRGAGSPPSSKEQTRLEDPAILAIPDPPKRKVGDPFEPEQPTEVVKELFDLAFADVEEYVHMLEEEGELHDLIGPREIPRFWSRHTMNAAVILDFLPHKGQVFNIDSSAGLPRIVIAICRLDLDVHLAEPMQRRCEWLFDVTGNLGLDNVTVRQARAEELKGEGQADVITARAVANMSKLVRMMIRLIAPGGSLMTPKGCHAVIETEEVAKKLKSHHLHAEIHEVPSVMEDESIYVVVCKRQKQAGLGVRAKNGVKPGLTVGSELNAESPRPDLWRVAGRGRRRMPV